MTRVTFGISTSSFAANMSVKRNAFAFKDQYPLAAAVVEKLFYVDDCLTGAGTVEEAARLQVELQQLFTEAKLTLSKWKSFHHTALQHVHPELREARFSHII